MAEIIPFPPRASRLAHDADLYRQALIAEALALEAAHDADPDDEIILSRLCTALILIKYFSEEQHDMPSEQPKLPHNSHTRDLAGPGANRNMPLQAGEVASYARPGRIINIILVAAIMAFAGAFVAFVIKSTI